MVTLENYEEYMLLEADGELAEAGQKELYAFLDQHPELKNELALYKSTILTPDTSLVYENKEQLLKQLPGGGKRTISLGGWWTYGAVAACLAVVLLLLRKPGQTENTPTVAITQHTNTITEPHKVQPVQQELHSIPKNPITKETIREEKHPAAAIARAKKQPAPLRPEVKTTPIPAPVYHNEEPIAKHETPVETQQPELPREQPEIYAQIPVATDPIPEITDPKRNPKLLALLSENRREGISEIASAVNEKIEKVKNLKNKIKDTDISFRFGNRELFVVKL